MMAYQIFRWAVKLFRTVAIRRIGVAVVSFWQPSLIITAVFVKRILKNKRSYFNVCFILFLFVLVMYEWDPCIRNF